MALTNSSSTETVIDQYLANADWEGDVVKARARREAIDWMLIKRPFEMNSAVGGQKLDYSILKQEFEKLSAYIASVTPAGRRPFTVGRAV